MTAHPAFDIAGRVAVVTGSSRGIGCALATGLAEAGAVVVLNGRSREPLEQARKQIAEHTGATVHAYAFDVTDSADVAAAAVAIEALVGPVHIVVNNTGVQHRAPLLEFGDEDFERLMRTNLTSAFLVGREFARAMVDRRAGKIVNICSVQSELGRAGIAPYAASKGGLKTPRHWFTTTNSPLGCARTPARRWGNPAELVGTLLFLASPASDFVNGQIVYVDGGMTAVV